MLLILKAILWFLVCYTYKAKAISIIIIIIVSYAYQLNAIRNYSLSG
jgi:hypothetical protein